MIKSLVFVYQKMLHGGPFNPDHSGEEEEEGEMIYHCGAPMYFQFTGLTDHLSRAKPGGVYI